MSSVSSIDSEDAGQRLAEDCPGHKTVSWDLHRACIGCRVSSRSLCTPSSFCDVCASWSPNRWTKLQQRVRRSFRRHKKWQTAEIRDYLGSHCSLPPQTTLASSISVVPESSEGNKVWRRIIIVNGSSPGRKGKRSVVISCDYTYYRLIVLCARIVLIYIFFLSKTYPPSL